MGYDRHNAALVVCCVLAILAAAAFLPAAGYGDYPDQDAVSDDHYLDLESGPETDGENGTDDRDSERSDDPDANESTPDEESVGRANDSDAEETNETDDENETVDDESGTNETSDESDDDSSASVGFLPAAGLLLACLLVVPIGLLWRATHPSRAPGVANADVTIPDGFLPRLQFRLKRIPQVTMTATIGLARVTPAIVDGVVGTGRAIGSGIGLVGRGLGRGLGSALVSIPAGLSRTLGSLGGLSISGGVASLFGGFTRRRRSSRSGSGTATRGNGNRDEDEDEPETGDDPGPQTVEEAWAALTELISARRDRSKTPGEYASAAVDAGFPESAVSTLTETFRQVRYGNYPPTDDRIRRARAAYDRIVATASHEDGDRE
ncbi:DUF4129 domain-containing protein [Natronosalvus caseinilyticus]|uniref:DUF4129 domain-containing protein n=1 Tax=Natronosalvus caseinilyticus TaxID=2953747 RepID=UPI0028AB2471|nr:DUF4129 domain-containing protein [Natronosalvus caseinilyticus]